MGIRCKVYWVCSGRFLLGPPICRLRDHKFRDSRSQSVFGSLKVEVDVLPSVFHRSKSQLADG